MEDIKEILNEEKIEKKQQSNTENFENINSPNQIQNILQLSSHPSKIGIELENNIIKSFLSFNNTVVNILDEISDYKFNPLTLIQNKKKYLYKLNITDININNNFLNKKIKQYNELKRTISEYNKTKKEEKEEKEEKKENENENENVDKKKFFLIQHPLINAFEEKMNI